MSLDISNLRGAVEPVEPVSTLLYLFCDVVHPQLLQQPQQSRHSWLGLGLKNE